MFAAFWARTTGFENHAKRLLFWEISSERMEVEVSGVEGAQTVSADNVEESIEIGTRLFLHHHTKVVGQRPFMATFSTGWIGSIAPGLLNYATQVHCEVGGLDDVFLLEVPIAGVFDIRIGGTEIVVPPGAAAMLGPADRIQTRGWSDRADQLFLLKFDRQAVEAELGRYLGRDPGRINFKPSLDIRAGRGLQWWQITQAVMYSLTSPDGFAWNPLMSAHLESLITSGLLLATDHQYRDELDADTRPVRPAVVQRAVAIMDERAHEPLTIPGIAAEVGTSVRSLQRGFRRYLEMSPVTYLAKVRLDRVHYELLAASPNTTSVSEVASNWGFTHLSRFAAVYRNTYGNLPSETLRR